MSVLIDLVGQRFGRLTVIRIGKKANKNSGRYWWCRCDCGYEKEIPSHSLRRLLTQSCGCLSREVHSRVAIENARRRRKKHGLINSGTYHSWRAMKARCLNPNDPFYGSYGGAGISIHQSWIASFESFLADVGKRPEGTSLDRFPDPAGNYEPGNVRWATASEQRRNRRPR
jgi:hypothetical protein